MHARILTAILGAALVWASLPLPAVAGGSGPSGPATLYLVRHAEKAVEAGGDPPLTSAGLQRAEQIADALESRDIESIWSSDYRRTRQTAAPLAKRLGITVDIYDPRAQEAFAEQLLASGNSTLVVGHSNTIPALAALLCGCEIAPIHDTEYGRLLVITVDGDTPRLEELRQREFFRESARP